MKGKIRKLRNTRSFRCFSIVEVTGFEPAVSPATWLRQVPSSVGPNPTSTGRRGTLRPNACVRSEKGRWFNPSYFDKK